MKVGLGSDHRGWDLKEAVFRWLTDHGHEAVDFGTQGDASVDYPDFAFPVAEAVGTGRLDRGVLICDTGIGMAIAANKVEDVRAAVVGEADLAIRTRSHNNTNVLVLAGVKTAPQDVGPILQAFLETAYEGGRHDRRLEKIHQYELAHERKDPGHE